MRTQTPFVLCLAVLLGGCLYPAERGKMLEERLDRLEADKKDLEADLKKQKARLDEQIGQVLATIEKVEKSTNKTGAEVTSQTEQLQAELAMLRGQLEQFGHQATQLASAFDSLKAATPPPPPEPAVTADGKDGKEGKDGKKPEEKPKAPERPADKKDFAALVEKTCTDEPAGCRKIADEWLRKFPKPDSAAEAKSWSPLAARVHYALGAAFVAQKEPRAALSEFGEIVKYFGKSEQAPDALLLSSDCFAALKMVEESKMALEEILNTYPKSEAAKTAKVKLADLKKPKKKK
ncbi:MAG: YbgF trimerization domain-containing protein [Myxococcales bacterium]